MSRSASSADPSLRLWHSVIDTCRQLPASDNIQLAKLDTIYPVLNGSRKYPLALERRWVNEGSTFFKEFEAEAEKSERQHEILKKAQEQVQQLIAVKKGEVSGSRIGTGGMGSDTAGGTSTSEPNRSSDHKRKRKSSPVQSLRLADLSGGGGQSSSRASPSVRGGSPYPASATGSMSPMPPSHPTTHSHGHPSSSAGGQTRTKSWKDAQLPLRLGRKVMYKPTNKGQGAGGGSLAATASGADGGDPSAPGSGGKSEASTEQGMLFVVNTMISTKDRYEVRDVDDSHGVVKYNTTIRSLNLLPDPLADPDSPSHPNAYEDFPPGSSVLALYPETTAFYKAVVITAPKPGTACGKAVSNPGPRAMAGKYLLQFADDEKMGPQSVDYDMVCAADVK